LEKIFRPAGAPTEDLREKIFHQKSGVYSPTRKTTPKRGIFARKMSVLETDLDSLVVRTNQLAGILDVSNNYVVVLTRSGVLEPLRKPNGTSVRGKYPLVTAVQAFSRYIRTENKKGSGAVSEAALQAARLRKFQAEAILRTIAAAERSGDVVPHCLSEAESDSIALTAAEKTRKEQLERIVEDGLENFLKVGACLWFRLPTRV
jgi:hypothetical protein